MKESKENEAFCVGVAVGLDLYQQRVLNAHERNEPLMINDELYYLQDGRDRLEMIIDKICR